MKIFELHCMCKLKRLSLGSAVLQTLYQKKHANVVLGCMYMFITTDCATTWNHKGRRCNKYFSNALTFNTKQTEQHFISALLDNFLLSYYLPFLVPFLYFLLLIYFHPQSIALFFSVFPRLCLPGERI